MEGGRARLGQFDERASAVFSIDIFDNTKEYLSVELEGLPMYHNYLFHLNPVGRDGALGPTVGIYYNATDKPPETTQKPSCTCPSLPLPDFDNYQWPEGACGQMINHICPFEGEGTAWWYCTLSRAWSPLYPNLTECRNQGLDPVGYLNRLRNYTLTASEAMTNLSLEAQELTLLPGDILGLSSFLQGVWRSIQKCMELHRAAENSALIRSAYKNIVKESLKHVKSGSDFKHLEKKLEEVIQKKHLLQSFIRHAGESEEEVMATHRDHVTDEAFRPFMTLKDPEKCGELFPRTHTLAVIGSKRRISLSNSVVTMKEFLQAIARNSQGWILTSVRWIRVEHLPAQLKLLSLVDLEFGLDPRRSSQDIDQEQDSVLLTVRRLLKRDSTCIILQEMGGTQETLETRNVTFLRNQERTHIHGSWFWMDAPNPAVIIISLEKLLADFGSMEAELEHAESLSWKT
ncbi:unnamed protein product [Darwinula stevensoni]|uniref:Uncharacterized protein n=1 Tax=Darwinula stevensoni TaxID=69355 RepID=A0A7R9A0Y0_9CRUS|nr:unnamed protein product [Darwinula stevensoni]CAG0885467.1 unnamed protein product [Darwinula stevensoni]